MPYARVRDPILSNPGLKTFTRDAALPTGNPDSVNIALGLSLLDIVLAPSKRFPLHLAESYKRMWNKIKEDGWPEAVGGAVVMMSQGGVYAGSLALLSPVRPNFVPSSDIETEMDAYGIAITIGSDVMANRYKASGLVETAIMSSLDFARETLTAGNAP